MKDMEAYKNNMCQRYKVIPYDCRSVKGKRHPTLLLSWLRGLMVSCKSCELYNKLLKRKM